MKIRFKISLQELIRMIFELKSNKESSRLIKQGAITINGTKYFDPLERITIPLNSVVKKGRKAVRIIYDF